MLKNHTNKRCLFSLAENAFCFVALFAFISPLCEHRNHGGVVSAFFLLQQLPPYEVISSDPWPTSSAEAENELKKDGHQQQIATNEPNNNNSSKVAEENATTILPTAISGANNSLFSVRVDINEQQQQQLKEEKLNSTRGMDKNINLSTTPNAAEIEDQNLSNKSSELQSMEQQKHDSHSLFNHFHPLGFINAVRHKKMLRKIRKLVAKGVHKYPF